MAKPIPAIAVQSLARRRRSTGTASSRGRPGGRRRSIARQIPSACEFAQYLFREVEQCGIGWLLRHERSRICHGSLPRSLLANVKTQRQPAALGQSAASINPVLAVAPGKIEEPGEPPLANKLLEVAEHFTHSRRPRGIVAGARGVQGGQPPFGEPARPALPERPTLCQSILLKLIVAADRGLGPWIGVHRIGVD